MQVHQSMPSLTSISSSSSAIPTLQTIQNPATPAPMTPMTPASADPGVVPQLQYVLEYFFFICNIKIIFNFKEYSVNCESWLST